NAQQPETSEPQTPTGGARPAEPRAVAPQPTTPTTEIRPGPPMGTRAPFDASELELQRALQGGVIDGRVTIPNQSAGILIQPQGRDWRQFRNRVLTTTGILAVIGTALALAVFYLLRGPTRIDSGRSGRRIARYTLFERANHWMTAASFIVLALTGLNITYGAYVLRPLIGPGAFTALTLWGQAVHHYVAFAFMAGVVVMLVHWARENVPGRVDLAWIRAGGPFSKQHPPAGKFNAAQKALYWFVMLGGIAVAVSGILLMLPGLLDNVVSQQWAHIAHGMLAMAMTAVILGHIYIGTIGMEGAFEGMRDGEVDYNWAREHHSQWLEEEVARARTDVANDRLPPGRVAGAD
ncbi:formate dehydrogenase subunit gamma, partial [Falsiroseomonas oryzae]|uniref:formate dehydrogenase subunit gamma n=1 Tax=Falsiroseomonas oryzae TaxID=2766473 RepID=UPI0022EADC96